MSTHHVETSERTALIEEQFNSLAFEHRVRIAAHTLIDKTIDNGANLGMRVVANVKGHNTTFEITIKLKEVE